MQEEEEGSGDGGGVGEAEQGEVVGEGRKGRPPDWDGWRIAEGNEGFGREHGHEEGGEELVTACVEEAQKRREEGW